MSECAEATGKVVAVEGAAAWVEIPRQFSCAQCAKGQGCGAGTLLQLFSRRAMQVKVMPEQPVAVGDSFTLRLPTKVLIRSALRAYLFPLLGLLLGAVLGQWLLGTALPGEWGAVLGGFLGLGVTTMIIGFSRNAYSVAVGASGARPRTESVH